MADRCAWLGPIVLTDKHPDRVTAFRLPDGRRVSFEEAEDHMTFVDAAQVDVYGIPAGWEPVIEPGTEITVRRSCGRRAGHRGAHGMSPWWHPLRASPLFAPYRKLRRRIYLRRWRSTP